MSCELIKMNIFTVQVKVIWTSHVGICCIFAGFQGKGLCARFMISLLAVVNINKMNNASKGLMKAFIVI